MEKEATIPTEGRKAMTHLIALFLTIAIIAGLSIAGALSTANRADFRTKQLQREVWRLEKTVAELRKQVNAQGEQINELDRWACGEESE